MTRTVFLYKENLAREGSQAVRRKTTKPPPRAWLPSKHTEAAYEEKIDAEPDRPAVLTIVRSANANESVDQNTFGSTHTLA